MFATVHQNRVSAVWGWPLQDRLPATNRIAILPIPYSSLINPLKVTDTDWKNVSGSLFKHHVDVVINGTLDDTEPSQKCAYKYDGNNERLNSWVLRATVWSLLQATAVADRADTLIKRGASHAIRTALSAVSEHQTPPSTEVVEMCVFMASIVHIERNVRELTTNTPLANHRFGTIVWRQWNRLGCSSAPLNIRAQKCPLRSSQQQLPPPMDEDEEPAPPRRQVKLVRSRKRLRPTDRKPQHHETQIPEGWRAYPHSLSLPPA